MEKITRVLERVLREFSFDDCSVIELMVAPEEVSADFSTNVIMKIAGKMGEKPYDLAEKVRVRMMELEPSLTVEVAGPGFLNFTMPDEYWQEKTGDLVRDFRGEIGLDTYADKTVIVEFSDPNPFKVLHVGHLYTSSVGEAIARLIEFTGGKVVRANFGGDVGLHVAKNIYAIIKHQDEILQDGEFIEMGASMKAEFMARCYVEGTRAYEEDETARAEIVSLNKRIYQIATKGSLSDGADIVERVYWWGREASYDYFKQFYEKIGVEFDKYYPESTVAERGLEVVKAQLVNGVYKKSDGAVVFNGEDFGLHTRVFINREGLPTYEAKDVGLLFTKWDDYHFDQSIIITGNDVIDYMKVVLKSVEQFAPKLTERSTHITHGNVKLPGNEKMSSRKGNFLRAVEVISAVEEALADEHGVKDDLVAQAAYKYAFLKYKIGGDFDFDINSSVSMVGNSGPYLLYAAVRAKKITEKLTASAPSTEWKLNEWERRLMKKLLLYKHTLTVAVEELAPHKICAYLYELAQEFNRFYENCQVVGSELEYERGEIVKIYLAVLSSGLELLNLKVPKEM